MALRGERAGLRLSQAPAGSVCLLTGSLLRSAFCASEMKHTLCVHWGEVFIHPDLGTILKIE